MKQIVLLATIALAARIYGQDNGSEELATCPGGFCVAKVFCTNGTYNSDPKLAQEAALVSLRLNDYDECEDYQLICCNATLDDINEPIEAPALSEPTCGQRNENGLFYNLHSNETVAQYGEYPWVVYIYASDEITSSTTFVCGGTLIHPQLVLTTAHNVQGKSNLMARFGEWDLGTDKEPFPTQNIGVDDILIHPSYKNNPIQNDIGLLVLKKSVTYQEHIQPICLPSRNSSFDGQQCISNGWGTTQGEYAKILKKLTLPVIPHAKCQRLLQLAGLGPLYRLRKEFICAGGEPNVDTCKGDGGSPLACQQADGSFVLAGIVSWGIGCGGFNIPGVYVAVSRYTDWINDQIYKTESAADL